MPFTRIELLEGLGVAGDAHCGLTVQHRWDKKKDPFRPNLRQVHLIQTEVFGLREPCVYIEKFHKGLLAQMRECRPGNTVIRKAGVMGVVITGGVVRIDDKIIVELPQGKHNALEPV